MNKNILIGCIIAIAILIGVSFTSVVGYRSVDSDIKASPLFNIRASRAIDEESEELSCVYVGKGEDINLLIPSRDDVNDLFQIFIDKIQLMEDESFSNFIDSVIRKLYNKKDLKDINVGEVIMILSHMRENKEIFIIEDDKSRTIQNGYTYLCYFIPTLCWFPFCIILHIPFFIIGTIWFYISYVVNPTCSDFITRCGG